MDKMQLIQTATRVRQDIIRQVYSAKSGHPGGSLSAADIMTALYFSEMRIDPEQPGLPGRDRFVLSKGHAAPALYAALAERGYFDPAELTTLRKAGSRLQGHPSKKLLPGVEMSTGSLGQGISAAVGMALANRLDGSAARVYTLLGDGELQEGMVWEAAMAAGHYKLDNLCAVVDHNGLQIDGRNDDVMCLGSIADKFRAFGFNVVEVADGNDIEQVVAALNSPAVEGKPKCIVAHTVKGKGVSFMEDKASWHGTAPNAEQCAEALKELED
jgi:transketolase